MATYEECEKNIGGPGEWSASVVILRNWEKVTGRQLLAVGGWLLAAVRQGGGFVRRGVAEGLEAVELLDGAAVAALEWHPIAEEEPEGIGLSAEAIETGGEAKVGVLGIDLVRGGLVSRGGEESGFEGRRRCVRRWRVRACGRSGRSAICLRRCGVRWTWRRWRGWRRVFSGRCSYGTALARGRREGFDGKE